jgi:hypothetical protein
MWGFLFSEQKEILGMYALLFYSSYSSRSQWVCLVDAARRGNGVSLTAIEPKTYPCFMCTLTEKDLAEVSTKVSGHFPSMLIEHGTTRIFGPWFQCRARIGRSSSF